MKKIYYNGSIITMEKDNYVEAVLVDNDKIVEVGSIEDLLRDNKSIEKVDLEGRTMLPAFIDAHSHFSGTASSFLQVPLEEAISAEEIIDMINNFIERNKVEEGSWVIGNGYDHNNFKNKLHPTSDDLDKVKGNYPIIIQHKSGHAGVINTKAMEILDITVNTESPAGGEIGKINNKLTGYLEENAFIEYLKKVPMGAAEDLFKAYGKAQQKYLSYGITTIQEGMMVEQLVPLYMALVQNSMLNIDVVGYSATYAIEAFKREFPEAIKEYYKNFKVGGYKIFLDGSPQARTAWMKSSYLGEDEYYGYGTLEFKEVSKAIREAVKNNMQILAHCNGDAAVQQYIDAIEEIKNEGYDVAKVRPVMIHAQFLDRDQLDKVKELGIIPSFFVAHVYHWGDIHIENFGLERASRISLAKSALDKGIKFTFHQDAPVIEPNMIETIHIAANRVTKSGVLLGQEERISIEEALKAVTINAAYQYFEEDSKGSIKVGKNADFVILDKNPLEVDITKIKDIKVLETIKNGKSVYKLK